MSNEYITPIQHKFEVGDKVRVTQHKTLSGAEGEIAALMPYTFFQPAYYVRIGGMITPISERSLEKIESQGRETV